LIKFCWSCLKTGFYVVILLSTALAIYTVESTNTDWATREIQRLKNENRRDEAIDLVEFLKNAEQGDAAELERLEKDLEYGPIEKFKSFYWTGAFKGEVFDAWSGLGAMTSDLFIFGDLRDIVMQTYKRAFKSNDFDAFVMLLSGAGVSLTCIPLADGVSALAKNMAKYVKRVSKMPTAGVLTQFISGKLSPMNTDKIWGLFKKTAFQFPAPHRFFPAYQIQNTSTQPPRS
jgi:hypothetical protein